MSKIKNLKAIHNILSKFPWKEHLCDPFSRLRLCNYSLSHEKPEMWDTNKLISNYVFTEKRTGEIASPTISIIFVELERFTKRLDITN